MNYREEIRKYISCPQLGDNHYGKWGALRVEQRLLIKRLLDELDRADNYVKNVYLENQELQQRIEKAIEYIKINTYENVYKTKVVNANDLLEILERKEE